MAVSDSKMDEWVHVLGADTGVFVCPEGGAVAAAVAPLLDGGFLLPQDEVVLFNTGSGLKYVGMTPLS